jgi:hypothetical protein
MSARSGAPCRRSLHVAVHLVVTAVSRTRARASGDVWGDGPSCLRAQPAGDDVLSERGPWVGHDQAALWSVIRFRRADFPLFLPQSVKRAAPTQ